MGAGFYIDVTGGVLRVAIGFGMVRIRVIIIWLF